MACPVMSHELTDDGSPAAHFGYGPACPVRVPGSSAELYLLRSWRSVLTALRDPAIRNLRAVGSEHAVAGVTLQHPQGLLRRTAPDTDIRQLLNPLFSASAAERWRPAIRDRALARARAIPAGVIDLSTAFSGLTSVIS